MHCLSQPSLQNHIMEHHVLFCAVIKVIRLYLYSRQLQLLLLSFASDTGAKKSAECTYAQTYDASSTSLY